ncbi:MAG: D-alanine--D-alanine ligase [Armatimonadetes bacterium]|nr:D-alanine--D-alanine ligase [Armatimonadota bacterium]
MGKLKVAVLMGGRSEEREISLKTGTGIIHALDPERYEAVALDTGGTEAPILNSNGSGESPSPNAQHPTPDAQHPTPNTSVQPQGTLLNAVLQKQSHPDVVFMALHGKYGEDGTVQGMLELLNVPYTGSGVLTSALAMNKAMTKRLFKSEGIPTPPFIVLDDPEKAPYVADYFALPIVVKPNQQGSSFGMTIVQEKEGLKPAVELALKYDGEALLEKYIRGTEITVAVLGNRDPKTLPVIEIAPKRDFYDFEAKYTPGHTEFHIPARIDPQQAKLAADYALRAHKLLGCRGVSRVDMIMDTEGIWVLEVNTIPGMTATSLVPKAAAAAGITYSQLCDRLIELALEDR